MVLPRFCFIPISSTPHSWDISSCSLKSSGHKSLCFYHLFHFENVILLNLYKILLKKRASLPTLANTQETQGKAWIIFSLYNSSSGQNSLQHTSLKVLSGETDTKTHTAERFFFLSLENVSSK